MTSKGKRVITALCFIVSYLHAIFAAILEDRYTGWTTTVHTVYILAVAFTFAGFIFLTSGNTND